MVNRKALAAQGISYKRRFAHRLSQYELPLIAFDRLQRPFQAKGAWDRFAVGDQARLAKEASATNDYLAALARDSAHTAIFSSEHLFAWLTDRELIRAFDDAMKTHFDEVTYVAYFRAPLPLIVSMYSENLKRGATQTLDEFIAKRKTLKGYFSKPLRWADAVATHRIETRLLDRDHLRNGDLIADFCHAAGIDHKPCRHPEPQNESLTYVGAEMLRALNLHIPLLNADNSFNGDRDGYLPEILHRTAGEAPLRLNARQAETVRDAAGPYVTAFLNRYFPGIDSLFPDRNTTDTEVNHQAVLRRAMVHLSALFLEQAGKPVNEAALAPPQGNAMPHSTTVTGGGLLAARSSAHQSASKHPMLKFRRTLRAVGRFRLSSGQKGWE